MLKRKKIPMVGLYISRKVLLKNSCVFGVALAYLVGCASHVSKNNPIFFDEKGRLINNGQFLSQETGFLYPQGQFKYKCSDFVEGEEGGFYHSKVFNECTVATLDKNILQIDVANKIISKISILDRSIYVRISEGKNIRLGDDFVGVMQLGKYDIDFQEGAGIHVKVEQYQNLIFYTDCEPAMDIVHKRFDFSNLGADCKVTGISAFGDSGKSWKYAD